MLGLEIELEMGTSYFNLTRRRSLDVLLHTNRELIILILQRLELGSKANNRRLIEFNSHARAKAGVTLQSAGFGRSSLIKILEKASLCLHRQALEINFRVVTEAKH